MHTLIRPTLYFNDLPWYNPKSILSHLENPAEPILDKDKSITTFKKHSKQIYNPILSFLLDNRIETNLILTAHFLTQCKKYHPDNLDVIKKLIKKGLAVITVAAYNGEDMSCLYNVEWWANQVITSFQAITKELGTTPDHVFVPQIYRALEIERIVFETGIDNFVIRQKGSKLLPFKLKLSDFRRFSGEQVGWINAENDQMCNFIALPDAQFYEPNTLIFLPNTSEQVKRFSMEVGLNSSMRRLKKMPNWPQKRSGIRLNEHPSLSLFNDLEKSVLRLWEYISMMILSRYHFQKEDPAMMDIFRSYSRIQNKDFLFYLDKRSYYPDSQLNFTSPYEAFATMQTIAKKLEINLQVKPQA
jgi:hypothetical protein